MTAPLAVTIQPRTADGTRRPLRISLDDLGRIGRGRRWRAVVRDLETGARVVLGPAVCPLGCWCDVQIVRTLGPPAEGSATPSS